MHWTLNQHSIKGILINGERALRGRMMTSDRIKWDSLVFWQTNFSLIFFFNHNNLILTSFWSGIFAYVFAVKPIATSKWNPRICEWVTLFTLVAMKWFLQIFLSWTRVTRMDCVTLKLWILMEKAIWNNVKWCEGLRRWLAKTREHNAKTVQVFTGWHWFISF